MNKFEMPEVEVQELNVVDVITTSCPDDCVTFAGCPNDTCLTD